MFTKQQKQQNFRCCRLKIAQELKEIREKSKQTFQEIEKDTRISAKYLQRLESDLNDINLSTLNQLAAYYDKKINIELVD